VELPIGVVDASNQVARTCPNRGTRGRTGKFIVTGRGGLPTSPIAPLVGDETLADWSTLDETTANPTIAPPDRSMQAAAEPIVEARSWIVAENGAVKLIAAASTNGIQTVAPCHS
jgi:large exoprotein involved in heme utilization and adhesion